MFCALQTVGEGRLAATHCFPCISRGGSSSPTEPRTADELEHSSFPLYFDRVSRKLHSIIWARSWTKGVPSSDCLTPPRIAHGNSCLTLVSPPWEGALPKANAQIYLEDFPPQDSHHPASHQVPELHPEMKSSPFPHLPPSLPASSSLPSFTLPSISECSSGKTWRRSYRRAPNN